MWLSSSICAKHTIRILLAHWQKKSTCFMQGWTPEIRWIQCADQVVQRLRHVRNERPSKTFHYCSRIISVSLYPAVANHFSHIISPDPFWKPAHKNTNQLQVVTQDEITSSPVSAERIIGTHFQESTSQVNILEISPNALNFTLWSKRHGHYASGWHMRKPHKFTGFKYMNCIWKVLMLIVSVMLLTRLSLVPFLSFCAQIKFRKFGYCCQKTGWLSDTNQNSNLELHLTLLYPMLIR